MKKGQEEPKSSVVSNPSSFYHESALIDTISNVNNDSRTEVQLLNDMKDPSYQYHVGSEHWNSY